MREFDELIDIIKQLRSPNGCLWDREQTSESLKPLLLEETYEVLEAIDKNDGSLKGELGDLLLHIVFQSDIAREKGEFEIRDVVSSIKEKMIRRHPHVFGEVKVKDSDEVLKNWESIKRSEEEHKDRVSILDGIPKGFPALLRAEKLQKKAAKVGFDWDNLSDVIDKVKEELTELEEAIEEKNSKNIKEEVGDLFFSLTNLARHLKISSELSLNIACNKFEHRFKFVEKSCNIEKTTKKEMNRLWNEIKMKKILEKK